MPIKSNMAILERIFRSGSRRLPGSTYIPAAMIFATRVLTWLAFPGARLSPDSMSYSTDGWLNFELVSFTGNAARGWPVTFFYALFPNDSIRILAQLLISGAAFSFLIHATTYILHARLARWIFSVIVLIIATSPQVMQWDTTILGTSLMMSSIVLLSTCLIRIVMSRKFDTRYFYLSLSCLLLLMLQKFSNIFLVAPILALLLILKYHSFRKIQKIIIPAIILISFPYITMSVSNQESYWGGSYSGTTLLWQLGNQSPASSQFKLFLAQDSNAPTCIYDKAPFSDLNQGIYQVLNECDGGKIYVKNNLKGDFIRFVIKNPEADLRLLTLGAGAMLTSSSGNYGNVVTIFPRSFYNLIWGEVYPDFRDSAELDQGNVFSNLGDNEPIFVYSPLLCFFALVSIAIFAQRFRHLGNRASHILFFLILCGAIQISFSFIFLPSEWVRQSMPYLVFMLAISTYAVSKKIFDDTAQ